MGFHIKYFGLVSDFSLKKYDFVKLLNIFKFQFFQMYIQ